MTTTRLRSGSALSLALGAVLALACVVCGAAGASAAAVPRVAPMTFTFDDLLPGTPQVQQQALAVPVSADITSVELRQAGPSGAVSWDVQLCAHAGACAELVPGTAVPVRAGEYAVTITATAMTLEPGVVSTLEGQIVLVESTGWLAATGSDLVWPLLALSTALIAVGAFFVAAARRHSRAVDVQESTC